ncbi:TniB family NTP-binding protein [Lichenibacterium dinghuense]|uniref:TniB family NTP-binding protein n=1 Tax=Lichenibacterium dinghuense TaxID=2895977 RepID=UPI001F4219DE|nr:TniB family NTP-binding protein [Lichenibacterium sp. 6Y81]
MTEENIEPHRPTAPLSDEAFARASARLRGVYMKRGYDADVRRLVDDLLAGTAAGREGRAILLAGRTGAGKSSIAGKALRDNAGLGEVGVDEVPVLSVVVPAPCTLKQLARQVARDLGYPMAGDPREHNAWERVRYLLADANVRILHLDEIQHITSTANAPEAVKVLNVLKGLMIDPRHPVSLLLSGLPEVIKFVEKDGQVRRRCHFVHVGRIASDENAVVADAVAAMAGKVDLKVPDDFLKVIVPRLVHAAEGQFGTAMDLAATAIERALVPRGDKGERLPPAASLDIRHFAETYQLRTGAPSFADPFTASDWKKIDVGLVLGRGAPEFKANGKGKG